MSLSKQLLILISALFLIIFSVNFIISFNNIKSYLEGEATVHTQDTATSLGLSLSHYMVDVTDPIIETTIKAIFDMGYYQEITLVDIEGEPLVSLKNTNEVEGVPDWFLNKVSMEPSSSSSEISSGWNMAGEVFVSLNPGYAYLKLYDQVKSSFYYSVATFFLSIALLLLLLRITLSPLKKIDHMAQKIAAGEFKIIDELPWTTEVRNVTKSMNAMSAKIEGMISSLNSKLMDIGKELQQDELTGLMKKTSFETEMRMLLSSGQDVNAFIFIIKIDALANLVKELGNDEIDSFIKDFAQGLSNVPDYIKEGKVSIYRFFGSEFCLLIQNAKQEQAEAVAQFLSQSFRQVAEKYNKSDIAHIGVTPYDPLGTINSILLAANEAYEKAQIIGSNGYFIRQNEDQAKDIAQWKALVYDIIDNHKYTVLYVGQSKELETGNLLMEDAFTQAYDNKGEQVAIGTFISIAEKYSKIVDLDKGVTAAVVKSILDDNKAQAVAISLSTRTIKNSDFRTWLVQLLQANQRISSQLVFSISSYAVTKDVEAYKEFINFIHSLNAKVMIKRFEIQSMSPEVAKELKPDYIRLARNLSQGLENDETKRSFIETMQGIGELLDINILAENVGSEKDIDVIKKIGIKAASR